MSVSGIIFFAFGARSALPLASGWQAYGHSYGAPTFTEVNDLCEVEGLIKFGAWGHLATLPANCRPNKRLIFNLNNHAATARVDVLPDGRIVWTAGGKRHGWISVSGIVLVHC